MTSRIIAIVDKAYERLKEMKTPDKSFSDVILELTERKGDLDEFVGLWSKEKAGSVAEEIKRFRGRFGNDLKAREHELP